MSSSQTPGTGHRSGSFLGRCVPRLPSAIVGLVLASAITQVTSYDTWVHLSLGRWMFENGRVPRANLLSYTQPDRPTTDHQWLFQACLYGLWRTAGIGGATLAKAALAAATFGFALATARRKGAGVRSACLVTLVAAFAARFRFTLRPDLVGLFFLSVYLDVLERWRRGSPRGIVWLLPLQVAWANLHGSSVMGWGLTLAYAASESLRALAARRLPCSAALRSGASPQPPCSAALRSARCDLALLWGVALALIPLTMLNPNGARVLGLPFGLAEAHSASGLKAVHEERASLLWADLAGRHLFFAIIAGVGAATLAASFLRRDITELGLFAALLCVAVHSARFVGVFAVAASPIVARNLSAIVGGAVARWAGRGERRRGLAAIGAAVALAAVAWLGFSATRRGIPMGLGAADGYFPEAELAFVQANYPKGNLLNEFEHGGYIWWRTRRPVFIDSRGLLAYSPSFVQDYVAAWASREKWAEVVERHQIAVALVARRDLVHMFRTDSRWEMKFQGMVCSVFARKQGGVGP